MSKKALGGVLAALGLLLVVVGVIVMFVVVPGMKQWPDDVDTNRYYTGQMPVIVNPSTFEFMNIPAINITRHVKTEATDGDLALVLEEYKVETAGDNPTPLLNIVKRYAIDRKTMESVESGYPSDWASKEGFWSARRGLALGWPMDSDKKTYSGWSDDYGAIVPLEFVAEEDHAGINTYHFHSASGPQLILPEVVTSSLHLPTELPKEQLTALLQGTGNTQLVAMIGPLLQQWTGETVPLEYYYAYEGDYWVEPATGVLIDTQKHELRKVGLGADVLAMVPLLANMSEEQRDALRIPVLDFTYQGRADSVKDAKADAEDAKSKLNMYGMILPVAAIGVGLILLIVGVGLLFARKPAAA